ncbi:hypothetical protein D3C71_1919650 [compost metagenome]
MIAAGGVDHSVRSKRLIGQQGAVVQRTNYRGDAQCTQFIGLFGAAHQTGDVVASLDQARGDGTADKTGGTGNEYVHGATPCVDE